VHHCMLGHVTTLLAYCLLLSPSAWCNPRPATFGSPKAPRLNAAVQPETKSLWLCFDACGCLCRVCVFVVACMFVVSFYLFVCPPVCLYVLLPICLCIHVSGCRFSVCARVKVLGAQG
jgi:hypothetical protein